MIPCDHCPFGPPFILRDGCTEEQAKRRALRGACTAFMEEEVMPDFVQS